MTFSSKHLEKAVEAFASLPGIGKKTALRLALHLVKQDAQKTESFVEAVSAMRKNIRPCAVCHNIADGEECQICLDQRRDRTIVCAVESARDIMAIEATAQFRGLYHVLGGVISPIEGVTPADLNIDSLIWRIEKGEIKEVVLAISPTIEGETTAFYLAKKIAPTGCGVSTIARGVAFGGELEYADELTLGRSIAARLPYRN